MVEHSVDDYAHADIRDCLLCIVDAVAELRRALAKIIEDIYGARE